MEERTLLYNIRQAPKPSTPVLVIGKLIMIGIPIAQIAVGASHLDDCPVQRYIPIYLVVAGVFTIFLSGLSCLPCTGKREGEGEEQEQDALGKISTTWNSLVTLFLFCWFIAGNVWIYSIYAPSYNPADLAKYCNQTVYLFAFWTTTLVYILMGALLVGGCCALGCMCLCRPDRLLGGHSDDV